MPSLPGTPKSDAERNAQAHLDEIAALYELHRTARSHFSWSDDYQALSTEALTTLAELPWNEGDGPETLRDAIQQRCYEKPLAIREHGYRQPGDSWNVTHTEIHISFGGPSCWIKDEVDDTTEVWFSQMGMQPTWLATTEFEQEALDWFCSVVAV